MQDYFRRAGQQVTLDPDGVFIESTPEFWTQIKSDVAKRVASHQKVHGRK